MQSNHVNYRFANLSRDAINRNFSKVLKLSDKIEKAGYKILCYNTDGIWYQDLNNSGAYSDNDEGLGIGQYSTDQSACTIRFKSKGSYEFIENGEYTPVVRGKTKLDLILSRDQWQWGDIYKSEAEPIKYQFDENRGIIEV
jgi:hypothetical protein